MNLARIPYFLSRFLFMCNRLVVLLPIFLLLYWIGPSFADDTGMAQIHDLRREGGKICLVGHYHYGNGTGTSRKLAEKVAISSWSSFTALEYGSDWARFYRAASKKISCSKAAGVVNCAVEARPCR